MTPRRCSRDPLDPRDRRSHAARASHRFPLAFHHNLRESLIQASGRVAIHDNLFVDVDGTALLLVNHDLPLKFARVYHNTIFGAGTGIHVASTAYFAWAGLAALGLASLRRRSKRHHFTVDPTRSTRERTQPGEHT